MPIPRELIRQVMALDTYDLRRLQMLVRGLLMDDPEPTPPEPEGSKVTFRQEMVRCGKEGCGTCPHGPYWYAYWREGGKTRSRYIGKQLPGEAED